MSAKRIITAVRSLLAGLLIYGMYLSASHIIAVGFMIGLTGLQATTLWVFVDLPVVIGKALGLRVFDAKTRKLGRRLFVGAGLLSLTCNVLAGHNLGERIYGAFIVAMVLIFEVVISKAKPAPRYTAQGTEAAANRKAARAAREETELQEMIKRQRRSDAARKGAATRKASAQAAVIRAED